MTDRSQAPGIQIYYEREEGIIFIIIQVNRVSRILSLSLPLYGECLTGIVMTELTHGKVNDVIFWAVTRVVWISYFWAEGVLNM